MLCVEGVSDGEVLSTASAVLEKTREEGTYTPLDLSGVTVVQCEGDGGLVGYGVFFSGIGLKTYAFYDRQKNAATKDQIDDVFDAAWEIEQTGVEYLLAEEIGIETIHSFLADVSGWDDYPRDGGGAAVFIYDPEAEDDDVRALCKRVLRRRKGSGYAQALVELCSLDDLPEIVVEGLERISTDLPSELSTEVEHENGAANDEVAAPVV